MSELQDRILREIFTKGGPARAVPPKERPQPTLDVLEIEFLRLQKTWKESTR